MLSLIRLECKQKNSSKAFRIRIFFFLSWGIEKIKTFIQFRSSLKNHTRFQTKMGKLYTRFQPKTAQKPYPMGRHIPIQLKYKRGVPRLPPAHTQSRSWTLNTVLSDHLKTSQNTPPKQVWPATWDKSQCPWVTCLVISLSSNICASEVLQRRQKYYA